MARRVQMTRLPIDELARRERLLRAARIRQVDEAFAASAAIVTTDSRGRRELVIMSGEPGAPRSMRVTYLAVDGPRGHFTATSRRALLEHVADGYPTSARPVRDDEVIAWTSSDAYRDGAARVAEVARANGL